MTIFRTSSTDPCFNLAAEEYLIDNFRDDVFMLWRNSPSVIIGRSQNAWAELDASFAADNGIAVVRRLSGGGAVFHDLGNVNFTFITDDDGSAPDFSRFCRPIIGALSGFGVEAELSGRNDIISRGVKISGNAQAHRSGRVLHHGTLLYSADLAGMAGALRVNADKLRSKGVKSVRSRVGNLKDLYGLSMTPEEFMEALERSAAEMYPDAVSRPFSPEETDAIGRLADLKYRSWEWNWGQSKQLDATRSGYFPFGLLRVDYSLDGGIISDISMSGDFFGRREISGLEDALRSRRMTREDILDAAGDIEEYITGAVPEDLASLMLGSRDQECENGR